MWGGKVREGEREEGVGLEEILGCWHAIHWVSSRVMGGPELQENHVCGQ